MADPTTIARRSLRRRLLYSVIVGVAIVVLSLGLAEIAARVIAPDLAMDDAYIEALYWRVLNSLTNLDNANAHPRYGYIHRPKIRLTVSTAEFEYEVVTNRHGFRTADFSAARPGRKRIVLLGDSMFEGVGTSEAQRVAQQLERLSGTGADRWEVFNLAVAGFNTLQALEVLRVHGQELLPQRVVLGFFVGNDVIANYVAAINEDGRYVESAERVAHVKSLLRGTQSPILFQSRLYRILNLRVLGVRTRYRLGMRDEVLAASCASIQAIAAETRLLGAAPLVVVLYPKHVARSAILAAWSGAESLGRNVAECARAAGIVVMDSIDIMRNNAMEQRYYWRTDGHFNASGERLVAQALWRQLQAQPSAVAD